MQENSEKSVPWALLGGVAQALARVLDHLAHVADAARALGLAALRAEDIRRLAGPRLDSGADLTFAVTYGPLHFVNSEDAADSFDVDGLTFAWATVPIVPRP